MKTLLILGIVIALSGSIFAQAPRKKTTASFTTTTHGPGARPSPTPPPIRQDNVQGVVPRALRGGNPLQMFNPKAPAKYGTAAQSVVFDPETGKWRGIKLFEILF
jgi:hypothetical protein